ncbi:MAG: hypothetical protein GXO94_07995 [Nitrospirae bacterium]|nr:hypothetical protein [Nitrospirota bacterium]
MRICSECVLPETFPGISFNRDGVCNFCQSACSSDRLERERAKYRRKFEDLLARHAGTSGYECLLCFSGGKDSAYTLDILKNRYGLRVLALTFDNGFMSPVAQENIGRLVEGLGVDHMVFRPRFDLVRRIFALSATESFYSGKTLQRASSICTSCISMVKSVALMTAIEKGIPFVVYGWSPGQAPLHASVMQTNPSLMKAAQRSVREPLVQRFGNEVDAYFLKEHHFERPELFPCNVHPLAFLEYDEPTIYARLAELGWVRPDDTDPNSTNCLLNTYANHVHQQRFGYNPYALEIANMVRESVMSREEGLRRLSVRPRSEQLEVIRQRLGIG